MIIPEITDRSEVKKGQLMGFVADTYAKHSKQIRVPFDGYAIRINYQVVVNQEDALFHIGSRA